MAKLYEDGGYLPTFFRDAASVDQARSIEVTLEQQVDRVDIHAAPGRLFTVAGRVIAPQGGQATVALASDTGTEIASIDGLGYFSFHPSAPGQYEILAQGPTGRGHGAMAAYLPLTVDRDLSDIRIPLSPLPTVQFVFEDSHGRPIDPRQMKVLARRKDIAGDAPTETLQVVFDQPPPDQGIRKTRPIGTPEVPVNDPLRPISGSLPLVPGRWDVALAPKADYCVVGFLPPQPDPSDHGRADGWNEMLLASGSQNVVKFVLSSTPSSLSGTVKGAGGDAVVGVPVFLEPYDLESHKGVSQIRATRTNAQGRYQFGGLAPGGYRLLGSFDYQMPDAAEMEAARAKTVKVEEGSNAVMDLEEFVIR
jgi:hypothetical protein